jgi:CheY-like chemotaxis protein
VLESTSEATDRLRHWRFDAVILDRDSDELQDILRDIRKGKRNRTCIALAIGQDPNSGAAFNMGANFVLAKPVGMERFSRLMHAAHSLVVRQRLRYHRHSVQIEAKLNFGSVRDFPVTITNLSEGGAEIVVDSPVVINGPIHVRFPLPETSASVEAKGELVWSNAEGRAGIRFVHPLLRGMQQFQQWLAERIQPEDLGFDQPAHS